MTSVVTIWHNIATDPLGRSEGMADGYKDGHPLVPVARYESEQTDADALANEAFEVFNVGHERANPDPRAVTYRERKNRSLSVGDVVQVTSKSLARSATDATPVLVSTWLAVARFGWNEVAAPKWVARKATTFGTTPLDRSIRLAEWAGLLPTPEEDV